MSHHDVVFVYVYGIIDKLTKDFTVFSPNLGISTISLLNSASDVFLSYRGYFLHHIFLKETKSIRTS
jgi:hypothetical protein